MLAADRTDKMPDVQCTDPLRRQMALTSHWLDKSRTSCII